MSSLTKEKSNTICNNNRESKYLHSILQKYSLKQTKWFLSSDDILGHVRDCDEKAYFSLCLIFGGSTPIRSQQADGTMKIIIYSTIVTIQQSIHTQLEDYCKFWIVDRTISGTKGRKTVGNPFCFSIRASPRAFPKSTL